jgi:hypothetical protein
MNIARGMLSKFEPMRLSILALSFVFSAMSIFGATPEVAPTPTVAPAAAE